jgi:hypothetical protein
LKNPPFFHTLLLAIVLFCVFFMRQLRVIVTAGAAVEDLLAHDAAAPDPLAHAHHYGFFLMLVREVLPPLRAALRRVAGAFGGPRTSEVHLSPPSTRARSFVLHTS